MRTIIADSGSTKTDWCWMDDGVVTGQLQTEGINPVHQSLATIQELLAATLQPVAQGGGLSQVFFYGAGCADAFGLAMREALSKGLDVPAVCVFVSTDMLGAARAVCGHDAGVACILGTGSNSCLYDGCQVVDNVPPLGYILGDEGSGAAIGKAFLNAIFKGLLPASLRDLYLRSSCMTYVDVIERVYRQPMANRFLASITRFISEHLSDYPELSSLVIDCFRQFFRKNIAQYHDTSLRVGVVGSVGFHFQQELHVAASLEGYHLGEMMKSPMAGLIAYHRA